MASNIAWVFVVLAACEHEAPLQSTEPLPTVTATAPAESTMPARTIEAPRQAPVANAEATIAGLRAGLRRCYDAALASDPHVSGRVRLRIAIASNGDVVDVTNIDASTLPESVVQCMLAHVRTAVFEAPGGSGAKIIVPINFVPRTSLDAGTD